MDIHFLIQLAFLVLIALSGFDSSSADPPSDFPERAKAQATNDIGSATRLLRNNSPADKGYTEERAGGLSVFAIETFKSAFTSSKVNPETLQKWLIKGKSADATFKRFHLDKSGNFFFDKPHFTDWIDYADKLSARFPEMSAISTLTRHYGDIELYDIIQTAKATRPDMEKLAIKLETEQMQRWIAIRKDPDEVFRLFKLNYVWENILKKPGFTTWAKYVDDLNMKHPKEPVRMYSTLTKYFTDDALFEVTKGAKSFKTTKSMAIKVEDDWIQNGIQHHKTPYQALLDVGLGHTTDQLMDQFLEKTSMLKTWFKYITAFNKKYLKRRRQ
ncbi:RxLR effector protein [Phytophthora megakarya]|uniref:RxLR effector protein n=1 Tax=Phytophthora megakarya TaxID=4795 RepID=A0A225W1H9_9STRA|nr:RxLR effector protein [Phytophthora megakarya]